MDINSLDKNKYVHIEIFSSYVFYDINLNACYELSYSNKNARNF